jgi:hypothetical protein
LGGKSSYSDVTAFRVFYWTRALTRGFSLARRQFLGVYAVAATWHFLCAANVQLTFFSIGDENVLG